MTALPDGWLLRRPSLDDVDAILRLVHASDIASVGEPDYTADDVREMLTAPTTDMSEDCWVVEDTGGEIVGWAFPHSTAGRDREFIEVYAWPQRGEVVQRPLLDLLLDRAAVRGARLGHDPFLVRSGAVPNETRWIETLTAAGFAFLKMHARMTITLDGAEPPAHGVTVRSRGVTVRPLRHDDEAEMRRFHAVTAEAFRDTDHPEADYPTWRSQVDAESALEWDEWLVGEVDGEFAGALRSSGGQDEDTGWVKSLAVLRAYRRQGVGAALLRRAFALYAAKGRPAAGRGVDMANPTEAIRLYHAVGMRSLYEVNIYQRSVRTSGLG